MSELTQRLAKTLGGGRLADRERDFALCLRETRQ